MNEPGGADDTAADLLALFDAVRAAPHAHDFFALLRRIEALHPDAPRIGRAPRPSQEALRLGQEPELDFAPAALASFGRPSAHAAAPRLGVRFFGLLGPQGPMPLHFTEHVRERLRLRNDPTLLRFLDVFHHRLLSLYYRAWAQAQPAVQHDRPADDRFAAWLGSAFGLGGAPPGVVPAAALLFQAGLLASRSRHPEGLAKLLVQYFGVPARIETHVAQRLDIEPADRSRLGFARSRPERAQVPPAALGRSATAGRRLHDRQYRFRVVLGPLALAQYRAFLPDGAAWPPLCEWVRRWAGADLRWDVRLCLAGGEACAAQLKQRPPLGVAAWLGAARAHRPPTLQPHDRADLRLRPDTSFLLRRRRTDRHA